MAPNTLPAPISDTLDKHYILNEIRHNIRSFKKLCPHVELGILLKLVQNVQDKKVDAETQARQFLTAFGRTPDLDHALKALDDDTRMKVHGFIKGTTADGVTKDGFWLPPSPPVKLHFEALREIFQRKTLAEAKDDQKANDTKVDPAPLIHEDSEKQKVMKAYAAAQFSNWGENIQNTPKYTFVPTTVYGVGEVVKYCKAHNLRVRCAGYRHSWSPTFSSDNEVLISPLDLNAVNNLPNPLSLGVESNVAGNELATIERLPIPGSGNPGKETVRVGVSVTTEAFRRWAIKNDVYALPMDAILVEVTTGGVNGSICHGAGRQHPAINDHVRGVEYIDVNGNLRNITNPEQLRTAAGCFGLLGVVTHITFDLHKMIYAELKPEKTPISLAIPPLQANDVPAALRKKPPPSAEELKAAQKDFEDRATDHYYSEWFWYTFQRTSWVNTWNKVDESEGAKEFPDSGGVFLQWLMAWIGGWFSQSFFFHNIPGHWQAQFLSIAGMAALPPTDFDKPSTTIKTFLPDGLHFFRGIQNMRVRDMELAIPLPASTTYPSKPDLSIVRRAWWDAINIVYDEAKAGRTPMRLTLELRIMGGSNMHLAPQRGNDFGTACIEVLTVPNAVPDEWEAFKQKIAEQWMSYTDAKGEKLNVRPHWAKEWEGLNVNGVPIRQHLKQTAYKDAIIDFKEGLKEIGKGQGWTLDEIQRRFSNELWDEIIYS